MKKARTPKVRAFFIQVLRA